MDDITTSNSSGPVEGDTASEDQGSSFSGTRQKSRTSSAHNQIQREIGLMRNATGNTSATFVGSASGIHFIRTVYNAFANKSGDTNFESPENNLVPGEDDHLGDGVEGSQINPDTLWGRNEITFQELNTPEDYKKYLSFEDLVDWTRSYFDNWHPPFPFLHAPTVMEALERISLGCLDEIDDICLMTIRSIISVSLADARQAGRHAKLVPACLTFKTFDEALAGLQLVLVRPTSLPALQATIGVQLFLVSMLRLNAASRIGGLVVRMAFHLGLHRCPARFPSFSKSQSQLRQRLFWSIYCLDRYLCHSLGLPLNIRDHDIDVCYPDEELHSADVGFRQQTSSDGISPPGSNSRLRLLTLLAKHAKFRGMILELRNKSIQHASESADRAVRIGAQLSKWWNEVEDLLESGQEVESTRVMETSSFPKHSILKPIHQLVLLISKHESLIALNRPVITTSKGTAAYDAALQTCIESSRSIISLSRRYLISENISTPEDSDGQRLNEKGDATALIWPSFTWAIWMSAFILTYAAAEGQVSQQTASRLADNSLSILRHLALRGNTWAHACAAAIRDLRGMLLKNSSSASKRKNQWQDNSPKRVATTSPNPRSSRRSGETTFLIDRPSTGNASVQNVASTETRHSSTLPAPPQIVRTEVEHPPEHELNIPQPTTSFYQPIYHSESAPQSFDSMGPSLFSAGIQLRSRPQYPDPSPHSTNMAFPAMQSQFASMDDDWSQVNEAQLSSFFQAAGNSLMEDPFGVIEIPLFFAGDAEGGSMGG